MAERLIRKADSFGAEQERDGARSEPLADDSRSFLQSPDRVMQIAVADGCGPHNERAIGDRIGHGFEFFRLRKDRRSSHGGACLAKRHLVEIHDAKVKESEVAHGASGSANIERVARAYQDNAEKVEFRSFGQAAIFYSVRAMRHHSLPARASEPPKR